MPLNSISIRNSISAETKVPVTVVKQLPALRCTHGEGRPARILPGSCLSRDRMGVLEENGTDNYSFCRTGLYSSIQEKRSPHEPTRSKVLVNCYWILKLFGPNPTFHICIVATVSNFLCLRTWWLQSIVSSGFGCKSSRAKYMPLFQCFQTFKIHFWLLTPFLHSFD